MASILGLLKKLSEHEVRFVLVGGMATALHGSALLTQDVDVCAPFDLENVTKILAALSGLSPKQRMSPSRPPLSSDPQTYAGWRNLYVTTDWGSIDFLSSVTGAGTYEEIAREALNVDVGGLTVRVMGLDQLIRAKRALGRPKDLRAVAELEAIRARRKP